MAENSYSVKFTPKAVDDLDKIYSSGDIKISIFPAKQYGVQDI